MVENKINKESGFKINKESDKPSRPKEEIISEFLYFQKIPQEINKKIVEKGDFYPSISINLEQVMSYSQDLFDYIRKDPEAAIHSFQDVIRKELKVQAKIEQDLDRIMKERFRDVHILFDYENVKDLIPLISDISKDLEPYSYELCRFRGRYNSLNLRKETRAKVTYFECLLCATTFEIPQVGEDFLYPRFCINKSCKADAKKDFKIIQKKTKRNAHGYFLMSNQDMNQSFYELKCETDTKYNYYSQKLDKINIKEEIEVIGFLALRLENKNKNRFTEYINVIDIRPIKQKKIDERVIETLREKLDKKQSYIEKLVDSLHPLTYLIDLFYPIKLISSYALITGGSWNERDNIRDTLNIIIAGEGATYKSSIVKSIKRKAGREHMQFTEINEKMSTAGFVGTVQRVEDRLVPTVRYGLLVEYTNGTLALDESQKMKLKILESLRCLERGYTSIILDGINVEPPTKGSLINILNCVKRKDGSYNPEFSFVENIGWKSETIGALLGRWDLYYIIEKPDKFVDSRIVDNRYKIKANKLLKTISKDLEIKDFSFPKFIENIKDERQRTKQKIDYIHSNWLRAAKEIYKKSKIPRKYELILKKFYNKIIENSFGSRVSLRPLNTSEKVLRAISSLHLRKKIKDKDFSYFKKNGTRYILSLRDNQFVQKYSIDINEIFKKVFKEFIITQKKQEINTNEILKLIRGYIKRNYYADETQETFEEEIDELIPNRTALRDNYPLRVIYENNTQWMEEKGFQLISVKKKGTVIQKVWDIDNSKVRAIFSQLKDYLIYASDDSLEYNNEFIWSLDTELEDIAEEEIKGILKTLEKEKIVKIKDKKITHLKEKI
ncbi:MAG: hypothetical protein R6U96_18600 [Promethearchaeia archaeon]